MPGMAGQRPGGKRQAKCGKRKGTVLFLLVPLLLLGVALGAGLVLDGMFPLPLSDRPLSTVVLDRNNIPLRAFADHRGVWRFPARPDEVSPLYLDALIAYEDQWFYSHPGINPFALVRAAFQNLGAGRVVSGGSTLTMQVARILDTMPKTDDRKAKPAGSGSLARKIRQMLRALQLEYHLTKDEILGLYLTHAPFGANIEGVRAAAYTWLGKDAMELTRAEAALLAVLPQAPSRFRPDRHPERATAARDKVLDRLGRFGIWTGEQIARAKEEPVIAFRFPSPMTAPLASRRLRSGYPHDSIISSTLDYELQAHVASLLNTYAASLPPKQSGAILVVDHTSMAVQAYVGSAGFNSRARQGHVDMVWALRSPGSALKPFIYGLALDQGLIHSHSLLLDVPRFGKTYDPGNFTGGFEGPVTAVRALQESLNLPAVQVLDAYGPVRFHDRLRHGGARLRFSGRPNLAMALGAVGTDLESLVGLYAAIARNGLAARPRLRPSEPLSERFLMSPGAAYITRNMLSRPLPGREGVARLSGGLAVAWKTGTSYGFRDAWALGIKGDFIVGVWIGRPDGSPSPGQYGAVTAVPLMAQVLEGLDYRDRATDDMPSSVTRETICWPSGLAASQMDRRTTGACVRRHHAWILDHQVPPTLNGESGLAAPLVRTVWVNRDGRRATPGCGGIRKIKISLWPWQAEPFIPAGWRRVNIMPKDSDNCPGLSPVAAPGIRIVSLADNTILSRQPGDTGGAALPLKALGGQGRRHWFLNRVPLGTLHGPEPLSMPMPGPGIYHLAVSDESGNADQISFRVISPAP
ncbi:MAG: penicillin-binding protein 1C [Desulfobacter sp.]